MSGGGSKTKTKYVQSPEQRQIFDILMPLIERLGSAGASGQSPYQIPDMPDISAPQPTADWWQNVSPEIKAGLWQPYQDVTNQLSEQFGGQGMMGSPLTGPTGAFGSALGEQVASRAGAQMPMQAWQMSSPGMWADYQKPFQQRQEQIQGMQMPFQTAPGMMGGTYSTPMVQGQQSPMGAMGSGMMAGAMPWAMGADPLLGIPMGLGAMMGGK